jgi:hypothetical protein
MKLRVTFGLLHKREISFWKHLDDFPKLIKFLGRNYRLDHIDRFPMPLDLVDAIIFFTELSSWDPEYDSYCSSWNDLFPSSDNGCDCGAGHTSFEWDHMFYCPKWRSW